MTRTISDEQILDVVKEAVVLALAVEPDQVGPQAKLLDDLGAESIDFLDITFRLEQMLPIRIPRDDLVEQFEEELGEETVVDADRRLTEVGAYLIGARLTGVDASRIVPGLPVDDVVRLWTVQTWVDLAARLVDSAPEKCPDCGGAAAATREDGGSYRIHCSSCQAAIPTVPGDTLNQQWLESERVGERLSGLLERAQPVQASEAES